MLKEIPKRTLEETSEETQKVLITIESLPCELIELISSFLHVKDVFSISLSSSYLNYSLSNLLKRCKHIYEEKERIRKTHPWILFAQKHKELFEQFANISVRDIAIPVSMTKDYRDKKLNEVFNEMELALLFVELIPNFEKFKIKLNVSFNIHEEFKSFYNLNVLSLDTLFDLVRYELQETAQDRDKVFLDNFGEKGLEILSLENWESDVIEWLVQNYGDKAKEKVVTFFYSLIESDYYSEEFIFSKAVLDPSLLFLLKDDEIKPFLVWFNARDKYDLFSKQMKLFTRLYLILRLEMFHINMM